MITRENAINILYKIGTSNRVDPEQSEKLKMIALCISAELSGFHFWGADEEDFTVYNRTMISNKLPKAPVRKGDTSSLLKYAFGPSEIDLKEGVKNKVTEKGIRQNNKKKKRTDESDAVKPNPEQDNENDESTVFIPFDYNKDEETDSEDIISNAWDDMEKAKRKGVLHRIEPEILEDYRFLINN